MHIFLWVIFITATSNAATQKAHFHTPEESNLDSGRRSVAIATANPQHTQQRLIQNALRKHTYQSLPPNLASTFLTTLMCFRQIRPWSAEAALIINAIYDYIKQTQPKPGQTQEELNRDKQRLMAALLHAIQPRLSPHIHIETCNGNTCSFRLKDRHGSITIDDEQLIQHGILDALSAIFWINTHGHSTLQDIIEEQDPLLSRTILAVMVAAFPAYVRDASGKMWYQKMELFAKHPVTLDDLAAL